LKRTRTIRRCAHWKRPVNRIQEHWKNTPAAAREPPGLDLDPTADLHPSRRESSRPARFQSRSPPRFASAPPPGGRTPAPSALLRPAGSGTHRPAASPQEFARSGTRRQGDRHSERSLARTGRSLRPHHGRPWPLRPPSWVRPDAPRPQCPRARLRFRPTHPPPCKGHPWPSRGAPRALRRAAGARLPARSTRRRLVSLPFGPCRASACRASARRRPGFCRPDDSTFRAGPLDSGTCGASQPVWECGGCPSVPVNPGALSGSRGIHGFCPGSLGCFVSRGWASSRGVPGGAGRVWRVAGKTIRRFRAHRST
jgi:hypothetical protein